MTYRPGDTSLIRDGRERDLYAARQRLALVGCQRGLVDIYGRNWPEGISQGVSRSGAWRQSKMEILAGYAFNIACENLAYPYYCTEKIWDAIRGGCLPIYHGRDNAIYEDFPRDSFLDMAEFQSEDALWDHVQAMPVEEYRERMNRCIAVYNAYLERCDWWECDFRRVLETAVGIVRELVGRT